MNDQGSPDSSESDQDRPTLVQSVRAAIGEVETLPQDQAVIRLAEQYAEMLEAYAADPGAVARLSTGLLHVLESLGMTPRSRAALLGGKGGAPSGATKLDEFRRRRIRDGQHDS